MPLSRYQRFYCSVYTRPKCCNNKLGTIYWAISFGKALVQLGTCDSIPITEE